MKRFYCTKLKTEVSQESATTISSTDERVAWFFNPNDGTYIVEYDADGLPIKIPLGAEIIIKDPKRDGEIYTLNNKDYKIPFMKEDADGLLQVKAAFDLGIGYTNIHFTNGIVLPITSAEFMDFAIWFVNKRNSFFVE